MQKSKYIALEQDLSKVLKYANIDAHDLAMENAHIADSYRKKVGS